MKTKVEGSPHPSPNPRLITWFAVVWILLSLGLGWFPGDVEQHAANAQGEVWRAVTHGDAAKSQTNPPIGQERHEVRWLDEAVNLAMLVPLGAAIALRSRRNRFVAGSVSCAGLSAIIELGQLFVVQSRYGSTRDFLLNWIGGAAGALGGSLVARAFMTLYPRGDPTHGGRTG